MLKDQNELNKGQLVHQIYVVVI